MTTTEHNQVLWTGGHWRNTDPEFADCWNVSKAEAIAMDEGHRLRKLAVRSWQLYFKEELDVLVQLAHGPEHGPCNCDGEVASATKSHLEKPRCHHPDYAVDDDPDLAPLYNKQEANWPDSCRRELTFGRNFDSLPGLTKEQTDGLYWAIAHNWTESLEDVFVTPVPERQKPPGIRGWHHTERMSGGILAWNYLAQSNCGAVLTGAWNSAVNWSNIDMAAATGTHEFYHFLGANHNNDPRATGYPSIHQYSIARRGYPNATDISVLKSLGYNPYSDWEDRQLPGDKLWLPRGEQPDDPTEPPPEDDVWAAIAELRNETKALRDEDFRQRSINESQQILIRHLLSFHR